MKNKNNNEEGMIIDNFQVQGLSCGCEGQIVEKKLKALKGVKSYFLSPITFKLKVTYDSTRVTIEDIQKAVSKGGAKAVHLPTRQ